jgi:hypothetical protein
VRRLEMKNVTLSIDDETLKAGRDYAKKHNMSLNALIRKLLKQSVVKSSTQWLTESFELMDKAKANSRGKTWKREDLHRV